MASARRSLLTRDLFRHVLVMAGKALFFFSIGVFVIEAWLFDINPGQIKVVDTIFSISFYTYITFSDLVHYFWIGFVFLGLGALLFAFSKYRFIPLVLAGLAAAFYTEIVSSPALVAYYRSTYACHSIFVSPNKRELVCPLLSMVKGHPNIPYQGNVVALVAFAVAAASYGVWRIGAGWKIALTETAIVASATLAIFEVGIYVFQRHWYPRQVTFYQKSLYLGNLTNEQVLMISSLVLVVSLGVRLFMMYRRRTRRIDARKIPSMPVGRI